MVVISLSVDCSGAVAGIGFYAALEYPPLPCVWALSISQITC